MTVSRAQFLAKIEEYKQKSQNGTLYPVRTPYEEKAVEGQAVEPNDFLDLECKKIKWDKAWSERRDAEVRIPAVLQQLDYQIEALTEAVGQTKIPKPFRIKFKDVEIIETCRTVALAAVKAVEDYEQGMQNNVPDLKGLKESATKAIKELDDTARAMPSSKKLRNIGLVMIGLGVLLMVVAGLSLAVLVGATALSGGILAPLAGLGAAGTVFTGFAGIGMIVAGGMTFFGRNSLATKPLSAVKTVEKVLNEKMNILMKP